MIKTKEQGENALMYWTAGNAKQKGAVMVDGSGKDGDTHVVIQHLPPGVDENVLMAIPNEVIFWLADKLKEKMYENTQEVYGGCIIELAAPPHTSEAWDNDDHTSKPWVVHNQLNSQGYFKTKEAAKAAIDKFDQPCKHESRRRTCIYCDR